MHHPSFTLPALLSLTLSLSLSVLREQLQGCDASTILLLIKVFVALTFVD